MNLNKYIRLALKAMKSINKWSFSTRLCGKKIIEKLNYTKNYRWIHRYSCNVLPKE